MAAIDPSLVDKSQAAVERAADGALSVVSGGSGERRGEDARGFSDRNATQGAPRQKTGPHEMAGRGPFARGGQPPGAGRDRGRGGDESGEPHPGRGPAYGKGRDKPGSNGRGPAYGKGRDKPGSNGSGHAYGKGRDKPGSNGKGHAYGRGGSNGSGLTPHHGGTWVDLSAELEQADVVDRLLLALGARTWFRRRFAAVIRRLGDRFSTTMAAEAS